jgi:hypothetical protein
MIELSSLNTFLIQGEQKQCPQWVAATTFGTARQRGQVNFTLPEREWEEREWGDEDEDGDGVSAGELNGFSG